MEQVRPSLGLLEYVKVLRRRWFVAVVAAILVPLTAGVLTLVQQSMYRAGAEVLLDNRDLAAELNGSSGGGVVQSPERIAQTQADLARTPAVAERVLRAVGVKDVTSGDFLAASEVTPRPNSDVLDFRVEDRSRDQAMRLATAYAQAFTKYRQEGDSRAFQRAREQVQSRIDALIASGEQSTPLFPVLLEQDQRLRAMEALSAGSASLVRPATDAVQVQPRLLRNLLIGVGLGVLLGIGFAFAVEALDPRVRSPDEVGELLGLPLLASLPERVRRVRDGDALFMLSAPEGLEAEAIRILRTNFELRTLDWRVHTVMVTSAVRGEGKTLTVANLAIAFARSGRRVALADFDFRHPSLASVFDLDGRPGVTDVALGRVGLEDAVAQIADERAEALMGAANLEVLPTGPVPPDSAEFINTPSVAEVFAGLRERASLVLLDAPPLLPVGDSRALAVKVDGLILLIDPRRVDRPMLKELRRVLDSCHGQAVGYVLVGRGSTDGRMHGTRSGRDGAHPSWRSRVEPLLPRKK
jgi:capsular exopolysaccharide synthesis family protein